MRKNLFAIVEACGDDPLSPGCNGILYNSQEEAAAVQTQMESENADNDQWTSDVFFMTLPPGFVLMKRDHVEQLVQLAEACTEGSTEHQEHVDAIAAGNEAVAS